MATFAGTSADDFIIPTANGVDYRGGQGNDTYIISALIPASAVITLTDTEGANKVQLADGLTIASSNFLANAVELTLSNGAKIQITGASTFTYDIGANATAGDAAVTPNQTYAAFAAALGAPAIPGSGTPNYVVPPNLPPVPTFSVTGAAAAAEGTDASFVVSLANRVAGVTYGTTVTLAQTGGATAGTDFANALTLDAASIAAGITLVGNVLTIPATSTVTSVTLKTAVTSDALSPETGEGLSVTLSAPTGTGAVIGAASTVTTAITDVPLSYAISANVASVFENAEVIYTVTASAPVAADTVVAFSVVPGDASAANQGTNNTNLNDFAAGSFNPSNVTIKAGTTTATYSVTAAADIITELPEAFSVKAVVAGVATPLTQATTLLDSAGTGGQTFTLTAGVDNLVGTAGNDVINGVTTGNTSLTATYVETFGGLDSIDGGAGNDTLVVTNPDSSGKLELGSAVTVKNVENLSLINAGENTVKADVQTWTGLTNVSIDERAGQDVHLDTKANVTTVSVKGGDSVYLTDNAAVATLATVSVDSNDNYVEINSDALTALSIKDSDAWVTVNAAAGARTLNVTLNNATYGLDDVTATAVAITTTGKASNFELDTDVATAVTIAGDKKLTLTTYDTGDSAWNTSAIKTITSTNTAGVTIGTTLSNGTAFTGGSGNDTVTINNLNTKAIATGAGDDTVNVVGTTLGAGGTIDGGDGVDTIAFSAADADALSHLSPASTYAARISNFEKVGLGQVQGGANNVVNLANLDAINYVVSAGTAPTTGTAAVQSIDVGSVADLNGGVLTVGGVDVTIGNNASKGAVADAIAAKADAIIAANPNIASVISDGEGSVTVTYTTTSGPQGLIAVVDNPSGVIFGGVSTVDGGGTNEVAETQTLQITAAAPTATGLITVAIDSSVGAGGATTDVQVTATKGETATQIAANLAAAIQAAGISTVSSVSASTDTVTIHYTTAAGNVDQVAFTDTATTGTTATPATSQAYVAPVAETQTFVVTQGTDADGGEIVVDGARIALAANQTIDQVGGVIAASVAAIQAKDSNVEGVAYDTATDTVTVTFKAAAGNVSPIAVLDNSSTGTAIDVTSHVTGIAGTAAGTLEVNHMANNGTFELTDANNGATTIVMTDATGTADSLNLKLNGAAQLWAGTVNVAGVESINITTTDSQKDGADAADGKLHNPTGDSYLFLNDAAATTITVSGNHGVWFGSDGTNLAKVTTLDASGVQGNVDPTGLTAAQVVAANGVAGQVVFTTQVTDKAVTVTTGNGNDWINAASVGTATGSTVGATITTGAGADTIYGSKNADVINAGSERDTVHSSGGGDTITLGAGNDVYALGSNTHSVLAKYDTITDFSANTYGQGTAGAANTLGATGDVTKLTGDTIDVSALFSGGVNGLKVFVATNAADAQTFIQNTANVTTGAAADYTGFALDSSSNLLYMDFNQDGVIDSVVKLAGVTTINEAAFATGLGA